MYLGKQYKNRESIQVIFPQCIHTHSVQGLLKPQKIVLCLMVLMDKWSKGSWHACTLQQLLNNYGNVAFLPFELWIICVHFGGRGEEEGGKNFWMQNAWFPFIHIVMLLMYNKSLIFYFIYLLYRHENVGISLYCSCQGKSIIIEGTRYPWSAKFSLSVTFQTVICWLRVTVWQG